MHISFLFILASRRVFGHSASCYILRKKDLDRSQIVVSFKFCRCAGRKSGLYAKNATKFFMKPVSTTAHRTIQRNSFPGSTSKYVLVIQQTFVLETLL